MLEVIGLAGLLYLGWTFITRKPAEPSLDRETGRRVGPRFLIQDSETEESAATLARALPLLAAAHGLPKLNLIAAAELSHSPARARLGLPGRYKYLLKKSYQLGFCRGPDITAYVHDRQELKKHQSLYVIWYVGLDAPFVFIAKASESLADQVVPAAPPLDHNPR